MSVENRGNGEFNRRYLTCQISAIFCADRGDRRKSQSLHRAHLAIFADRGDRPRCIKSPSVSRALSRLSEVIPSPKTAKHINKSERYAMKEETAVQLIRVNNNNNNLKGCRYSHSNKFIFFAACDSGESLTGSIGFFASPNFPNFFLQYSSCTWDITVPSGNIIKLTFHHFMLGWGRQGGARLTITNVASDDGYQPFELVGWSLPSPVYSVGNSIQVIFTSPAYRYPGFNASYMAITYDSGKLPHPLSFIGVKQNNDFCLIMNLENE